MSNVFGNSFSTNYMIKTAMGWDMQISNATYLDGNTVAKMVQKMQLTCQNFKISHL